MRAYELMVIVDGSLDDQAVEAQIEQVKQLAAAEGARVATTDLWGKRRFAYEIDHKHEGFYAVFELVTDAAGFPELERTLRLADNVVRHKLIRLPDAEAARRGLLGEATPAEAG
jgi:small subunit ribosomal protein S6